jgi:hypothetical protein
MGDLAKACEVMERSYRVPVAGQVMSRVPYGLEYADGVTPERLPVAT